MTPRDKLAALLDKDRIMNHAGHDSDCQKWVIAHGPDVFAMYDEAERLREALERIGWHELTWAEARDVARAALDGKEEGYDPA